MIAFRARMILGTWGFFVLLGGLVFSVGISAEEPEAPKNKAQTQDEKPDTEEQKSGNDLLKQIREATAPILAELAEKHGYRLEDDQVIRRVAPPFPELRATYYEVGHPTQAKFISTPANAMSFYWDGKKLENWGMTFGSAYSIVGVVDSALKIKSQDIEGPKELLSRPLEGDWVIRPGAEEEKVVEELQSILQKEFKMRVELFFAKRIHTVYVASGKYEYTPSNKEDSERDFDVVQIYAKKLGSNGAGGGSGDFDEFLRWAGRWIEMTIINEVKEPPAKQLTWYLNQRNPATEAERKEDHDPESVIKNIAAQTGLTFKRDYRAIRRLVIKPIE